ncbi:MAG: hypothetical protein PHD03_02065 [Bacilli bacterium]|nr:hypothetical protein [Bacilli bacterium]
MLEIQFIFLKSRAIIITKLGDIYMERDTLIKNLDDLLTNLLTIGRSL